MAERISTIKIGFPIPRNNNILVNKKKKKWCKTTDIPVMALKEQIIENHNEFLESLHHRFLDEERKTALQKFANLGFPTKKDEEYKYTNLKEITEKKLQLLPERAPQYH